MKFGVALMAPLKDPEILAEYIDVLSRWSITDCVVFKRQAQEFARQELGCDPRQVAERMNGYVLEPGSEIDQVVERRQTWKDEHDQHHDLRFTFQGDDLYAETVLIRKQDPYYSTIVVVKLKYRDERRNRACQVQT